MRRAGRGALREDQSGYGGAGGDGDSESIGRIAHQPFGVAVGLQVGIEDAVAPAQHGFVGELIGEADASHTYYYIYILHKIRKSLRSVPSHSQDLLPANRQDFCGSCMCLLHRPFEAM